MSRQYFQEIDSLRAVAVLAVIFFHIEHFNVHGGFLGVDIFFVISGFLISNFIILRINDNEFSFTEFYINRSKRLLPALLVVCVTTIIIGYIKYQPESFKFLSLTVSSVLLFVSNILFYYEANYFNELANQSPLLHTWSLSVEEQFYLFFPIITFFIFNKRNKKLFLIVLIFMIFTSLIFSQMNSQNLNTGYFFLIQSRMFELGIGALCSYILIFEKEKIRDVSQKFKLSFRILPFVSILSIFISFFIFDKNSTLPGLLSLFPVISTFIFILTIKDNDYLSKIFSNNISVSIGKMSYSLYLWHFPILIFYPELCETKNILFYFILLFFISFLSWKYVEQPIRNIRFNFKKFTISIIFFNSCLLLTCIIIYYADGLKEMYKNRLNIQTSQLYNALNETKEKDNLIINNECKFLEKNTVKRFINNVNGCLKKHQKFILILGDSHGIDVYNSIAHSSEYPFIIGLAQGNCRPDAPNDLRKKRNCHFQKAINFVHFYQKHIKSIIYTQKGSYLLTDYKKLPILKNNIEKIKNYLEFLITKENYPVIWFGPNPEPNIDFSMDIKKIQQLLLNKKRLVENENKNIYVLDKYLNDFLTNSKIIYLSKIKLTGFNITNDFYYNDKFTYSDTDHWSAYGELLFGERIMSNSQTLNYFK